MLDRELTAARPKHANNDAGYVTRRLAIAVLLVGSVFQSSASAQVSGRDAAIVATLRTLLSQPESRVDLARAKLALDRLIDPQINVAQSLAEIDRMVERIRARAGGAGAPPKSTLTALRDFLYVASSLNEESPFRYDLKDPLGENISNKLLSNYLRTRLGNCVTMPILFVILADRLGLPAVAAAAPHHILVKFTDRDSGKTYNLETTSGAHVARDAWYREQMPMNDLAIANGLYLKALNKRETVALMASTVLEHLAAQNQPQNALAAAAVLLAAFPNDIHALLSQGNAAAALLDLQYYRHYATPAQIPAPLRADYARLVALNRDSFKRAQALGWQETK